MPQVHKPWLIPALLTMKCPNCRKGHMFVLKGIFPISKCLDMRQHCEACGMKMVRETNNGFGINYVVTVMLIFLNLLWYVPIFGISYEDNSIYYYLITSTVITVLLQPWLLRFSRALFLYFTVMYGSKGNELTKDN